MPLHLGAQPPEDCGHAGGRRPPRAPGPGPACSSRLAAALGRPREDTRGRRSFGLGVRPARVRRIVVSAEAHGVFAGGGRGGGGGADGGVCGCGRRGAGYGGGTQAPTGLDLEAEIIVGWSRGGHICVVGFEVLVCSRVHAEKGRQRLRCGRLGLGSSAFPRLCQAMRLAVLIDMRWLTARVPQKGITQYRKGLPGKSQPPPVVHEQAIHAPLYPSARNSKSKLSIAEIVLCIVL